MEIVAFVVLNFEPKRTVLKREHEVQSYLNRTWRTICLDDVRMDFVLRSHSCIGHIWSCDVVDNGKASFNAETIGQNTKVLFDEKFLRFFVLELVYVKPEEGSETRDYEFRIPKGFDCSRSSGFPK
jgi:hypothetical protein